MPAGPTEIIVARSAFFMLQVGVGGQRDDFGMKNIFVVSHVILKGSSFCVSLPIVSKTHVFLHFSHTQNLLLQLQ
jgi:hypothetical protein